MWFIMSPDPAITKRTLGTRLRDLGGRLDEVVGALLIGDSAEEGDDLVRHAAFDAALDCTALCTVTTLSAGIP